MTASTHRDCTQGGIATSTLLSSQLKGRLKSREGRGYSRPLLLLLITLELWALKKKNRLSKRMEWNAGRVTNTFMLYLFGLTFSTIEWRELPMSCHTARQLLSSRREQYYWVGYWYWVILGCFWKLVLLLGIVKAFMQNWYWYWVLLKPFYKIGIGIGYC